jgi:hypothetical protein
MKIEVAKFYENKTRTYLLPCLVDYGLNFQMKFNQLYKFAVGIHDSSLNYNSITEDSLIYILFDKELSRKYFSDFINWLKGQPYFVTDYVAGTELDSRKHMVVLRIPDNHEKTYEAFVKGQYSKMYTDEEKVKYFSEAHRKKALNVLNRTYDALLDYVHLANIIFDHNLSPTDCKDHNEYEFPLSPMEEIFNYQDNLDDRTFNSKYEKAWIEMHKLLTS